MYGFSYIVYFLCLAYKYLSVAPDVTATENHCITVTVNFKKSKGMGTPRFYQFQYRVSAGPII